MRLFIIESRDSLNIEIYKLGKLEANCYILNKDNNIIVIDPGDDYYILKNHLADKHIVGVLITHGHNDHIGALDSIVENFNPPVEHFSNLEEKRYTLGDFQFEVIFTPGHSKDSVSYYFYEYNILFSGDFLFKNTVGRMDFEGGSSDDMKESLRKISQYDERIKIYPGHGESTYLKDEVIHNQYFEWIK